MPSIKVAILGFGTVGEGIYQNFERTTTEEIKKGTGHTIDVVSILVRDTAKARLPTPGTR